MSTRSNIIAQLANGQWARIYCHFDGYISGVGKMLQEHYTTQEKVEQLIALGDISALGEEIGVKHSFDGPSMFDKPPYDKPSAAYTRFKNTYGKMCTAYGRDRGEEDTAADIEPTLEAIWPEEDSWAEFVYVWVAGMWFVADPDGDKSLITLHDALAIDAKGENAIKSLVKTPFGAISKRV